MAEINPQWRGDFFHDGYMPGNLQQKLEAGKPYTEFGSIEQIAAHLQSESQHYLAYFRQRMRDAQTDKEAETLLEQVVGEIPVDGSAVQDFLSSLAYEAYSHQLDLIKGNYADNSDDQDDTNNEATR